jgi:Transglycosylase-like domain
MDQRIRRINLCALGLAGVVTLALVATAYAGSGGIGTGGGGTGTSTATTKYSRIWDGLSSRDHKWAHRTSDCESGGDPQAIGGGGRYRGAFQFTKPTWNASPKSPGGDPIRYVWKTQAVVAVLLKHHQGTNPWPVCG